MIVGIDATNIRSGGGVTHLVQLLASVDMSKHSVEKVIVWASLPTLDKIHNRSWIVKKHYKVFEKSYLRRALWQRYHLSNEARLEKCDLLYVPGGAFVSDFHPLVTMNRNLLPFEWGEIFRYRVSLFTVKLVLLRIIQKHALRNADGVIFLTNYARDKVLQVCGQIKGTAVNIPHGISENNLIDPSDRDFNKEFSESDPCRILYVSTIDFYKHQNNVVEAVENLVNQGFPVSLDLIGGSYGPALKKLNSTIKNNQNINYLGPICHDALRLHYKNADIGVFASSCETFGQILVEKMAACLPIACSNRSCMPEILGNSGVYFDPEDPDDIARSIQKLLLSKDTRRKKSQLAYQAASKFSWSRCAYDTFSFIEKTHKRVGNDF